MVRASGSGLMPSCWPSGSTSRTSRARMRSLIRCSVVVSVTMRHHSSHSGPRSFREPVGGARPSSRTMPASRTVRPGARSTRAPHVVARWRPAQCGPASCSQGRIEYQHEQPLDTLRRARPGRPDDAPGGPSRRPPADAEPTPDGPGDTRPRPQAQADGRGACGASWPRRRPRWWWPTTATGSSSWPPSTCPGRRPCSSRPGWPSTPSAPWSTASAGRLGEAEPSLLEALAQIRLAFVQLGGGRAGRRRSTGRPGEPDRPRPARPPARACADGSSTATSGPPGGLERPRCPGTDDRTTAVPDVDGAASRRRWPCSGTERRPRRRRRPCPARAPRRRRHPPDDAARRRLRAGGPDAGHQWTILESGELQDVGGALVLQRGDERVDVGLGHHGLERVARRRPTAPRPSATACAGSTAEHRVEAVRRAR